MRKEKRDQSVRPSFREAFARAAKQIGLSDAVTSERDAVRELCYIIAEVYILDPSSGIRISDEVLDAYLVQEVFEELTLEHLRLVRENFSETTARIRNKRAYLRTALYNSVFELEAHYENIARHDMYGGDR